MRIRSGRHRRSWPLSAPSSAQLQRPPHRRRPSRSARHLRHRQHDAARARRGHAARHDRGGSGGARTAAGRARPAPGAAEQRRSPGAAGRAATDRPGPAGNVGGYNNFWLDGGTQYITVDGQKRRSLIIDPPDGRVPAMTDAARAAQRVARGAADVRRSSEDDPGFEAPGAYDDPERRPLGERCLLGFGSTSGPPTLPNYFYNNLNQIVQTTDTVLILIEMVHDARVVRMNAEHLPPTIRKWMGDSVGHWEGDTLVVDTTNFTDKTRFRGSGENLHVVERFTRVDAEDAAVPVHGRGSVDVGQRVDRRVSVAGDRRADLRVRLPRRQLRARRHPARRASQRT